MQEIGLRVPEALKKNYPQGFSSAGKAVPHEFASNLFPAAYGMKASGQDMIQFLKAALGLPGTPTKIKNSMRLTETPFYKIGGAEQGMAWEIHPLTSENKDDLLNPPKEMTLGPLPAKALDQNEQQFNGNALIDKTGATNGFRSYIALIPNQKSGIVILTNRYVSNREIVKTGRTILFKLLG
jgi:beta-lactamase class C